VSLSGKGVQLVTATGALWRQASLPAVEGGILPPGVVI
jgi:hypothetical protein